MASFAQLHRLDDPKHRSAPLAARWLQVALVAVVGLATLVGALLAGSGSPKLILIPVAVVLALGMAILACTRFAAFVLFILGIRSVLDATHSGGSSTSAAGTSGALGGALSPSSVMAAMFLLAAFLWLAARHFSGTNVRGSRLTFWLVAFWLTGMASLSDSQHVQEGLVECLRILSVVMMFVVLEQLITSDKMMARVIVASYASMIAPLGYTLYGMLLGHPASEEKHGFTRIIGTFTQSNGFARYLAFMIIFGVAIFPYVKGRLRTALGVMLVLGGVFLVLTLTLGAMLGTIFGIVLVAALQHRKALGLSVVTLAVIAALAAPGLSARVSTFQPQSASTSSTTTNSLIWRVGYWTDVLPLANADPVTGIGLDSTVYETNAAKQPHNDFIRAYVETGILGLVAYLGMLVALVGTCRRAVRNTVRRSFDHAVASGALACAACFILESVAANVITDVVNVWYLLAFAACAGYIARKEPSEGETARVHAPAPAYAE